MNPQELILAALAASDGAVHTPVQVQKLAFLLTDKISQFTDGPQFTFVPHDYGPFDGAVYRELQNLEADGLVDVTHCPNLRWRSYRVTPAGQNRGREILNGLDPKIGEFVRRLSKWLRSLSFAELVSAIYARYPEMKVNSVFQGEK